MYNASYGSLQSVAVGIVSALAIPANPKRCTLVLFAPSNAQITLSQVNPAVVGTGITLNQGIASITLRRHEIGPLIAGPLQGIATVATTLNWIEASDESIK